MRVWTAVAAALVVAAGADTCPSQCSCSGGEELDYRCSRPSANYIITAISNDYLKVDCKGGALVCSEFPRLQTAAVERLPSLYVRECALPAPSALPCALARARAADLDTLTLDRLASPLRPAHTHALTLRTLMMFNAGAQTSVPTDVLRSLPSLTHYRLCGAPDIALHEDMFLGAPPLRYLELSTDNITVLPARAFTGLRDLHQLNVWGNRILNISADAFSGLDNVRVISLNKNYIVSLPDGVFTHTPLLQNLTMTMSSLTHLQRRVFDGLQHIQEIIISNTVPLTLEEGLFSELPALRILKLDGCRLQQLPPHLIHNSSLDTLSLATNRLHTLEPALLYRQHNITSLNLNNNNIQQLDPGLFAYLTSLRHLHIERNQLQALPDGIFAGLRRLETVSLKHNFISMISDSAFQGASSLRTLELSHNQLEFGCEGWQSPLNHLVQLQQLSLTYNNLTVVCDDWKHVLLRLQRLDLSHNHIGDLESYDVHFFSEGIIVDLTYNNITSLYMDSSMQQTTNNTILLQHNPFACDCNLYSLVDWLQRGGGVPRLELGDTRCTAPTPLRGLALPELPPARLTCAVPCAPCSCHLVPALGAVTADCSRDVTDIDPTQYQLSGVSLRLHYVNGTNLSRLPPHVTSLDISRLNLTHIPCDISRNVKHVELTDNAVQTVPVCLLARNMTVRAARNPLACDCAHADLLAAVAARKHLVLDYPELQCAGAEQARLEQVDAARLCDVLRASIIGGSLACVGVLLVLCVFVFHRWRLEIVSWLYARGVRRPCWGGAGRGAARGGQGCRYDVFVWGEGAESWCARGVAAVEEGGLRACSAARDWHGGELVPEYIARSLLESRAALLYMSRGYTSWDRLTFLLAAAREAHEPHFRVLVVLVDEDVAAEDRELRACLSARRPLRVTDPMLTEKILYKLRPRRSHKLYNNNLVTNQPHLKLDVNNKLTNPAFVAE